MIRDYQADDFQAVLAVINDAAEAYRGAIPDDCFHEPYMSADELADEIRRGVRFILYVKGNTVIGVMGLQQVDDVKLIRHAYVRTPSRRRGIGAALLDRLRSTNRLPLLVGTWADATWAIDFYRKHGFVLEPPDRARRLLERYWTVSPRQIETSVVLSSAHVSP